MLKLSLRVFTPSFDKFTSNLLLWEYSVLRLVNLGSKLQVLPFKVDLLQRALVRVGFKKDFLWHIVLVWYCLDLCHLCYVAKYVTLSSFSETEFVNFHLHFLSRLTAGVLAVILCFVKTSLMQFWNLLFQTQRKFAGMLFR